MSPGEQSNTKQILAYAGMQVAPPRKMGVELFIKDWNEVYDWAAKELDCINNDAPGIEKININDAIKNFEEASYYLALSYFWVDEYTLAKELVHNLKDVRSKILYASALWQLAKTDDEYKKAFNILDISMKNGEYAVADKATLEETVYTIAALSVASVHKNIGSPSDMECAVSVLNQAFATVKNEDNKEMLKDELKHYQKKLFGGYKYIG